MNSDQHANAVFYVLALILPLSALLMRRVTLRTSLTMGAAWVAIFVVGLLIVGAIRELSGGGWARVTSLLSDDEQHIAGGTVRLRMAPDGHFWATASINGVSRRMMIDSGATTTSLNLETAKAAGLDLAQSPFPVQISTANGMIFARTSSVARLALGPIQASNLRVVVAPEFGEMNVLGMNFLLRLQSWRVEDRTLILQPRTS
jgi:aspartyl protease family protein